MRAEGCTTQFRHADAGRRLRGDLRLEEDEDEDENGGDAAGEHHPGGEGLVLPHGVNKPASDLWVGHHEALWHHQFLKTNG